MLLEIPAVLPELIIRAYRCSKAVSVLIIEAILLKTNNP